MNQLIGWSVLPLWPEIVWCRLCPWSRACSDPTKAKKWLQGHFTFHHKGSVPVFAEWFSCYYSGPSTGYRFWRFVTKRRSLILGDFNVKQNEGDFAMQIQNGVARACDEVSEVDLYLPLGPLTWVPAADASTAGS